MKEQNVMKSFGKLVTDSNVREKKHHTSRTNGQVLERDH